MEKKEFAKKVEEILNAEPIQVLGLLAMIDAQMKEDAKASIRACVVLSEAIVKAGDLAGAVALTAFYAKHAEELKSAITLPQMREVVRRSATTTVQKLLVDSIGLNSATATAIVKRLNVLMALQPGVYVESQSWGFGQVQSIDEFYGKVIIDFEGKKNHAMSLAVAGQNLAVAPEDHIMTKAMKDRTAVMSMVEKHPAQMVREMLHSYGPMPIQRLQDRLIASGLIEPAKWKAFWEAARRGLKSDKTHTVDIPTKRSEPLVLSEDSESFGAKWLQKFSEQRDIKTIYEQVQAYLIEKKDEPEDSHKATLKERLEFGLKGAYLVDYARYSQFAVLLRKLGFSTPSEQREQAEILLDREETDHLLLAMHGLAARDVSAMVGFLLTIVPEKKLEILERLDQLSSVSLGATLAQLAGDEETGKEVRKLLTRTSAPVPTLVVWALRNRAAAEVWKVPSLNDLIIQAIHIIEQRLTGEQLRMRNALQAFFDSAKWLEDLCKQLNAFERKVIFERIQASIGWETSSQRNVLIRMVRFDHELASLRRAVKAQTVQQHLTSLRSLTAFNLAFEHLINVEIPANTHDISTARSYGDLRENAEYQFARDHQRVLHSKQDEMERQLKVLKSTDFASSFIPGEVAMGSQVTVNTKAGDLTYTILGELDRDEKLNIISCRSRLAIALLGKKLNETVDIPAEKGTQAATIKAIEPLGEAIQKWLSVIPTKYNAKA